MPHSNRAICVVETPTAPVPGRAIATLATEAPRKFAPGPAHSGQKALVVDDDPLLRKLIECRLTAEGFEVAQAGDGAEALEHLEDTNVRPDLILLDCNMPELDGFDVLKHLASDPVWSSIPVVILTARRGRDDMVTGLSTGARDYLTKPIMADDLMARVNRVLGTLA